MTITRTTRRPRRFGDYRLLRSIGRGKRATVYAAERDGCERDGCERDGCERDGQPVAVKVLRKSASHSSDQLLAFYDEAKSSMAVSDERLLRVDEVGQHRGRHFVVMQHAPLGTLEEHVRRHGPMWEDEAVAIVEQLRGGLAVIHDANGPHGRLHPGHVLLDDGSAPPSPTTLIRGLRSTPEAVSRRHRRPRRLPQRFAYYAPEQLQANATIDESCDEYALAAMLLFLLTGQPPFEGTTLNSMLAAKCRGRMDWLHTLPSGTSHGVREMLREGLHRSPSRRAGGRRRPSPVALPRGEMAQPIADYQPLELIGTGRSSRVYRAEDGTGRTVALKVLRPDVARPGVAEDQTALLRFYQSAKFAMQVDHPHFATGYEVGEDAGTHFFASAYAPGDNLAWRVKQQGPLDVGTALQAIAQTASAVAALHEQGLIHRDIKPANLIDSPQNGDAGQDDESPHVTLVDLGSAKDEHRELALTMGHRPLGTLPYMSPEQCLEAGRATPEMDIYALGVTLYVLLTGRFPCPQRSYAGQMQAKLTGAVRPLREFLPQVSDDIVQLVNRATHIDPTQRHANAQQFAKDAIACLPDEARNAFLQ